MTLRKWAAIAGLGAAMLAAQPAFAIDLYTDLAEWQTDVATFQGTRVVAGTDYTTQSEIVVSGGSTLNGFSADPERRTVGTSWGTWPDQPGSDGTTVYYVTSDSITFDFTAGIVLEAGLPKAVDAFGFRIEPNLFGVFDITVTLETGEVLTQSVDGFGGAAFFGWTGDGITTVTITADAAADGFAFGEFYEGATAPIPEPSTYMLMALGMLGLAFVRRRRED